MFHILSPSEHMALSLSGMDENRDYATFADGRLIFANFAVLHFPAKYGTSPSEELEFDALQAIMETVKG